MVRKILTFKSKNLLGENRTQEKKRLTREVIKAIRKEGINSKVLDRSSLVGATKNQLRNRREILKKAGHSKQKPMSVRERRRFL